MRKIDPKAIRSAPLHYSGKQRILLIGTNVDRQRLQDMVAKAAEEHGIEEYEAVFTSGSAKFYEHFFGSEHFATQHASRRLPRVIITTGWGRQHNARGVGMTVNVLEFLNELSAGWDIPLVIPA